jgi:hypothetical protein
VPGADLKVEGPTAMVVSQAKMVVSQATMVKFRSNLDWFGKNGRKSWVSLQIALGFR